MSHWWFCAEAGALIAVLMLTTWGRLRYRRGQMRGQMQARMQNLSRNPLGSTHMHPANDESANETPNDNFNGNLGAPTNSAIQDPAVIFGKKFHMTKEGFGFLLIGALALAAMDALSKYWVQQWVPQDHHRIITPFFALVHTWNYGVSYGFFSHLGPNGSHILGIVQGVLIGWIIWWYGKSRGLWTGAGLVLMIGGAMGNVLDRLIHKGVFDFLYVHYGPWQFPAFNLGDVFLTLGFLMVMSEYGAGFWLGLRK